MFGKTSLASLVFSISQKLELVLLSRDEHARRNSAVFAVVRRLSDRHSDTRRYSIEMAERVVYNRVARPR